MNQLKSMGSVVAQVGRSMGRRNFSSPTGSGNELNVKEKSVVPGFALRVIPFCVGYGVAGPIIFGEKISLLEEKRKEVWNKMYGESAETVGDVRDMVVPGLGEIAYSFVSGNAARWWSAKKSWWSAKKSGWSARKS